MKTTSFFPRFFGPKTLPDRFSMLSSKLVYTSIDFVLELKLILSFIYCSTGNWFKYVRTITDLAVPESPTNMHGYFYSSILPNRKENLFVSTVGTSIFANLPSDGGWYSVTFFSQPTHNLFSLS